MATNPPSSASISIRLSIMMFIQFFIWGVWYVTGPNFLSGIGFGASDFGWMYSVGPIAGMISPFFVGMIADRFFAIERVLAAMHIMAGIAMVAAIFFMKAAEPSPNMINIMFFLHMLCYFPTLALTNTLAMKNMTNAEKQFPLIRVFGTIGWIVAGLTLTALAFDKRIEMFYIAAGSSIAMGVYSVFLPHTPAIKSEKAPTFAEIIGLDAFTLFKNRSFLVFMVASFLICIPLAFYYQIASRAVEQSNLPPALTMSYGQMSEIFFMLIMPLFFARLGVKYMLLFGMLAWVARYALFAIGAPDQVVWMMIAGVVLHGICYDFFFVTGQIYTDKIAPKAIRGQAQGMLVLFTLGLGMFIGAQVAGRIEAKGTPIETPIQQGEAGVAGAIAGFADPAGKTAEKLKEDEVTLLTVQQAAGLATAKAERSYLQALDEMPTADTLADGITNAITAIDELAEDADDDAVAAAYAKLDAARSAVPTLDADDDHPVAWQVLVFAREQEMMIDAIPANADADAMRTTLAKTVDERAEIQKAKSLGALRSMDWKFIWGVPAIMAGVVMILFFLLFKDDKSQYADHGEPGDVDAGDVAMADAAEVMP